MCCKNNAQKLAELKAQPGPIKGYSFFYDDKPTLESSNHSKSPGGIVTGPGVIDSGEQQQNFIDGAMIRKGIHVYLALLDIVRSWRRLVEVEVDLKDVLAAGDVWIEDESAPVRTVSRESIPQLVATKVKLSQEEWDNAVKDKTTALP